LWEVREGKGNLGRKLFPTYKWWGRKYHIVPSGSERGRNTGEGERDYYNHGPLVEVSLQYTTYKSIQSCNPDAIIIECKICFDLFAYMKANAGCTRKLTGHAWVIHP
jgi:hypothetical protein